MFLRVATWNCRWGGLGEKFTQKKLNFLNELGASFVAISEYGKDGCCISDSLYLDRKDGRGIAVAAFSGTLTPVEMKKDKYAILECVLPAIWRPFGSKQDIRILSIWATGHPSGYLVTLWIALDLYENWLSEAPSIILGDFNQSAEWHLRRPINFKNIVERLKDLGFKSAYHEHHKEEHGKESMSTFCSHLNRKSHIDFIFVNSLFNIKKCELIPGPSDHVAVVADLELSLINRQPAVEADP